MLPPLRPRSRRRPRRLARRRRARCARSSSRTRRPTRPAAPSLVLGRSRSAPSCSSPSLSLALRLRARRPPPRARRSAPGAPTASRRRALAGSLAPRPRRSCSSGSLLGGGAVLALLAVDVDDAGGLRRRRSRFCMVAAVRGRSGCARPSASRPGAPTSRSSSRGRPPRPARPIARVQLTFDRAPATRRLGSTAYVAQSREPAHALADPLLVRREGEAHAGVVAERVAGDGGDVRLRRAAGRRTPTEPCDALARVERRHVGERVEGALRARAARRRGSPRGPRPSAAGARA